MYMQQTCWGLVFMHEAETFLIVKLKTLRFYLSQRKLSMKISSKNFKMGLRGFNSIYLY